MIYRIKQLVVSFYSEATIQVISFSKEETVFVYLKNISQSIPFRDVVSRFEVRNVDFLVRLVKYLANETGNIISVREFDSYCLLNP